MYMQESCAEMSRACFSSAISFAIAIQFSVDDKRELCPFHTSSQLYHLGEISREDYVLLQSTAEVVLSLYTLWEF